MTHTYQAWAQAKRETRLIRDELGMKVDKDIFETVSIMRLLGFNTTGSCGGHIRRMTTGPYVIFQSPEAQHYANKARQLNNKKHPDYRRLRQKADHHRAVDLDRRLRYLGEFYRNHSVNVENRLIVQSIPMSLNILRCQGAEMALVLRHEEKKILVNINRLEIKNFTHYLIEQYLQE